MHGNPSCPSSLPHLLFVSSTFFGKITFLKGLRSTIYSLRYLRLIYINVFLVFGGDWRTMFSYRRPATRTTGGGHPSSLLSCLSA